MFSVVRHTTRAAFRWPDEAQQAQRQADPVRLSKQFDRDLMWKRKRRAPRSAVAAKGRHAAIAAREYEVRSDLNYAGEAPRARCRRNPTAPLDNRCSGPSGSRYPK